MQRFILAIIGIAAVSCGLAAGAAANTTQFVSMTFAEPIHPSITCPGFPDVSCGSGEVVPLGQASEIVVFGAGCGGECDLRTIYLSGGSLIFEETARLVEARSFPSRSVGAFPAFRSMPPYAVTTVSTKQPQFPRHAREVFRCSRARPRNTVTSITGSEKPILDARTNRALRPL